MSTKKAQYEENYKDFFTKLLNQPNSNVTPPPQRGPVMPTIQKEEIKSEFIPTPKEAVRHSIPAPNVVNNHAKSMFYEDVVLESLPMGKFYHVGTRICFRDCTTREIEHFSTLDEKSQFDFIEKLNDLLEECILFTHADGTIGSYLDVKEGDRPWLIYMIREKTFPLGKVLVAKTYHTVKDVKEEIDIELKRENFEFYPEEENSKEWYDSKTRCLHIYTTFRDEPYVLAPPTIGLQRCYNQFLKIQVDELKNMNLTDAEIKKQVSENFYKIAPYLSPGVTYLSYDSIKELYEWYHQLKAQEYSFLQDLFNNHLKIGIAGLKKKVAGGTVRHPSLYPQKRRSLFVLSNAFELFVRKPNKPE